MITILPPLSVCLSSFISSGPSYISHHCTLNYTETVASTGRAAAEFHLKPGAHKSHPLDTTLNARKPHPATRQQPLYVLSLGKLSTKREFPDIWISFNSCHWREQNAHQLFCASGWATPSLLVQTCPTRSIHSAPYSMLH